MKKTQTIMLWEYLLRLLCRSLRDLEENKVQTNYNIKNPSSCVILLIFLLISVQMSFVFMSNH